MSEIFGVKRLKTIDDWVDVVSRKHYKIGHSAFEIAHRYHGMGKRMPEPIYSLLQNSHVADFRNLEVCEAYIEFPVHLNDNRHASRTDAMIFAHSSEGEKIVICIEAKALEEFGPRVFRWINTPDSGGPRRQKKLFNNPHAPIPGKLRRLQFLNEVLSLEIKPEATVRYQLLHRTASAILIARQTFAKVALVLIHAFAESDHNSADFQEFCRLLSFNDVAKNKVIGPYFCKLLPETPIYFLYAQDRRKADSPLSPLFENSPANAAA